MNKQISKKCFRSSCKKCCKKWIGRLANRGARRIEILAKKLNRKIFHFLLSPPRRQYLLSDRNLIRKVLRIIREANFSVAVIFHPYRKKPNENSLYYSPHFHLVGIGWKDELKKAAEKYGWYSKCFRERKSTVFYTLHYLLSHCGVKKGFSAIRWSGKLSYRKIQ